jgi:hypothetical protein
VRAATTNSTGTPSSRPTASIERQQRREVGPLSIIDAQDPGLLLGQLLNQPVQAVGDRGLLASPLRGRRGPTFQGGYRQRSVSVSHCRSDVCGKRAEHRLQQLPQDPEREADLEFVTARPMYGNTAHRRTSSRDCPQQTALADPARTLDEQNPTVTGQCRSN